MPGILYLYILLQDCIQWHNTPCSLIFFLEQRYYFVPSRFYISILNFLKKNCKYYLKEMETMSVFFFKQSVDKIYKYIYIYC